MIGGRVTRLTRLRQSWLEVWRVQEVWLILLAWVACVAIG